MLKFKFGKFYKDTEGREWEYCGYTIGDLLLYNFRGGIHDCTTPFFEQEINVAISKCAGYEIKIPFVEIEEKERNWVVGEEYECYNTISKKISKVKVVKIDEDDNSMKYVIDLDENKHYFFGTGKIISWKNYVVFKNGMPEELKERINKNKQTDRIIRFQKGKKYKFEDGCELEFKRRIKTKKGLYIIFESENGDPYTFELYMLNGIECKPSAYGGMHLCADESIRNQDSKKAIRILK